MDVSGWPLFRCSGVAPVIGLWLVAVWAGSHCPTNTEPVSPLPSKMSLPITSVLTVVCQHNLHVLNFCLLPALLFHQNSSQEHHQGSSNRHFSAFPMSPRSLENLITSFCKYHVPGPSGHHTSLVFLPPLPASLTTPLYWKWESLGSHPALPLAGSVTFRNV